MTEPVAIHMRNVVFGHDREPTLLRIDEWSVSAGTRLFLHGPSGSGKTTLLGLLTGILVPQQGSCLVLGKDLTQMTAQARDRHRGSEMGYIFQTLNLIPYLTVGQNVALPCQIHAQRRKHIRSATLGQEVERLLLRLGLRDYVDRNVKKLSTGQQQRVAIARAVIGQPRLVIADEPTSSLDDSRRQDFLDLLFAICDEAQSTLIFVSHDLSLSHRFDQTMALNQINQAAS